MTELEQRCIAAELKMTGPRKTILKVPAESSAQPLVESQDAELKWLKEQAARTLRVERVGRGLEPYGRGAKGGNGRWWNGL